MEFQMKHVICLTTFFVMIGLVGCQNVQKRFCDQSVSMLCSKCEQCGGDYKACGLNGITQKSECISTLSEVCAAYDGSFKQELSQNCLEQINQLSCEKLKSSGKPEICTRLF